MKITDKIVLEEVRKASANTIPDAVWDVIEAEVAVKGITGLSGTARAVIESVVQKHGGNSHNQKNHAGGRGGGGSVTEMDGLPPKDAGKRRKSDPNVSRSVEWDKSHPDHSEKVSGSKVMRVTDTYSDGSKKVYRISNKNNVNGDIQMKQAISDGVVNGFRLEKPKSNMKLGDPILDGAWERAHEAGVRIDAAEG